MGWRNVDRSSPGVREPTLAKLGEEPPQVLGNLASHAGINLDPAAKPGAGGQPPAAPAEGDPPVGRGAEVVDQGPRVADALAAGPAQLLKDVRDRLGDDDVAGGHGEAPPERSCRHQPTTCGEHRGPREDAAGCGLGGHAAARGRDAADAGALEDPHPPLDQARAQAEREASRLHGCRAREERTPPEEPAKRSAIGARPRRASGRRPARPARRTPAPPPPTRRPARAPPRRGGSRPADTRRPRPARRTIARPPPPPPRKPLPRPSRPRRRTGAAGWGG